MKNKKIRISVIGGGYVGLPLAIELGKYFDTFLIDKDKERVRDINRHIDHNQSVSNKDFLKSKYLKCYSNLSKSKDSNIYILTLPTPVDQNNIPDLSIHFIDIVYGKVHPRAATITTDDGNILKRIPLNGQPGDMIYYDTPHSDYISQELFNPDINSNIPTIELQFKRNDKSIYDFKGLHYDLKIEVTELVEPTILNELASHMRRDRKRFIDEEGSVEIGGIDYVLGNMDVSENNNTR